MSNRVNSDSANTVSLFPFLAVLLCTMGALLVLLVVLAQRAGQRALAAIEPVAPASFQQPSDDKSSEAEELLKQIEEVRAYQVKLDQLQVEGKQKLEEEKQRLSYLENQTRELEHELARLVIAVEQLQATEENQAVDQQQAERELKRLKQLIVDTEKQLEELREESKGKRSYAIVPYVGPNGTLRKPIYLECQKDAIVLHPEGIRLLPGDFLETSWPGNPLAAVLRATRKHINAQATQLGQAEPPDPYPLILIRPEGIPLYLKARAAISSWDSTFGYEFIDSDWNLEFQEGPNPLLAGEQQHALFLARERLAQRVRAAPRRFQGIAAVGGGPGSSRSFGGQGGFGGNNSLGSGDAGLANQQSSVYGNGGRHAADRGGDGQGTVGSEAVAGLDPQFGNLGNVAAEGGASAGDSGSESGINGTPSRHAAAEGSEQGAGSSAAGQNEQYGQSGGDQFSDESLASSGNNQSGAGGSSGGRASAGGSPSAGGSQSLSGSAQGSSIAESHGRNWAVEKSGHGAVPIRRPIQVVVREDRIALLPSRHASQGEAATGTEILLNQPADRIAKEFVNALRGRVKEWGLAGRGLYWRPVMQLNVAPNAEQTANQVLRLLKNSGVEVSLPETARAPGGSLNAPH